MRKNPTIAVGPAGKSMVDGIEMPITAGGVQSAYVNDMPIVSMEKNDGDQKDVASPAFASGKDLRSFEGGARESNPAPGKPGA